MLATVLLVVAGLTGHVPKNIPPVSCILSNGDRLSGELLSVSSTRVRIRNEVLGRITLKRTAIAVCESPDSLARQQLGELVMAPMPETPITSVAVVPDLMPIPPRGTAPVVSLERLSKPKVVPLASRALPTYVSHVGWKRSLGTTYMLTRGNANVSSLGFTGSVARRSDRSQIALSGKREFGSQDGSATENYLSATLRYDLALGPNDSAAASRPSFFSEAVVEHDPFAKIGRRAVENAGVSVPLSRSKYNNLALEMGAGVTHEAPSDVPSYTRFGGLLRLAARQIFGTAKSDQQIAIFPDLSGPHGHYRINGDINLSAPLAKAIALKLGIANRFDTRPQTNVRKNDITIQSGIGVEF
jgi:putative salt-induced outer membrane protein YdiY